MHRQFSGSHVLAVPVSNVQTVRFARNTIIVKQRHESKHLYELMLGTHLDQIFHAPIKNSLCS